MLQLAEVCRQVACGMDHISGMGYVHSDLAARNCLLRTPLVVKIGDFGMATNGNGEAVEVVRPVRWMAPETLTTGSHTINSDVWAFGVLMWEVFSYGATPHCELSNWEVVEAVVVEGRTLHTPPDCPVEMERLMRLCWSRDAEKRPTFQDAVAMIQNFVNVGV